MSIGIKKYLQSAFTIAFLCLSYLSISQTVKYDSIPVKKGKLIFLDDSIIVASSDTIFILPHGTNIKIKENSNQKSQAFYDSLRIKANENRWSKELYNALIINSTVNPTKEQTGNFNAEQEYEPYQGLIISEVSYKQVNVFGGSIIDTTQKASGSVAKTLNKSHINTLDKIIAKNINFKVGDPIEAITFSENERYLRSLKFIDEVTFKIIPVDSIHAKVVVVTKDVYPLSLDGSASRIDKFYLQVNHYNFLGTGQGFKYRALYDGKLDPSYGSQLEYSVHNLYQSQVSMEAKYHQTAIYAKQYLHIGKDFNTRETKYAFGLEYEYLQDSVPMVYEDTTFKYRCCYNSQSAWIGRNFILKKANPQNIAIALKYTQNRFTERPYTTADTNQYFENYKATLASCTYLQGHSIKTRYLRSFGRTEDVFEGYLLSSTVGYIWTEFNNASYTSIRLGYSKAFSPGGYFLINTEYGSFQKNNLIYNGAFEVSLFYYSPLLKMGCSQLRNLIQFQYLQGINRYDYEWVNLSNEIKGLSSDNTKTKSKTVVQFESVLFTPDFLYGFRFAPYIFGTMAFNRSENWAPFNGNSYSCLGIGLRIRNENLIFQNFDLSFIYYPTNSGSNKTFNFFFDDREPQALKELKLGDPEIMDYN